MRVPPSEAAGPLSGQVPPRDGHGRRADIYISVSPDFKPTRREEATAFLGGHRRLCCTAAWEQIAWSQLPLYPPSAERLTSLPGTAGTSWPGSVSCWGVGPLPQR